MALVACPRPAPAGRLAATRQCPPAASSPPLPLAIAAGLPGPTHGHWVAAWSSPLAQPTQLLPSGWPQGGPASHPGPQLLAPAWRPLAGSVGVLCCCWGCPGWGGDHWGCCLCLSVQAPLLLLLLSLLACCGALLVALRKQDPSCSPAREQNAGCVWVPEMCRGCLVVGHPWCEQGLGIRRDDSQ